MQIKLDNEDFLLGAITAHECEDLQIQWLASGNYESTSYVWHLVSYDGQSIVVLHDPEEGTATIGECFSDGGKREVACRLIDTMRRQAGDGYESALAVILSADSARVNPKLLALQPLLQCMQKGMNEIGTVFDTKAWAKQVGFK